MIARDLAKALDISEATMSRLLSGERQPSLGLILKINRVMGWSVEAQAWVLQRGAEAYGGLLRCKMEALDTETSHTVE